MSAPEAVRPDAGLGFRVEMAVQNVVMGYWRYALVALGGILIAFFLYGQYDTWRIEGQRVATAEIASIEADVERKLVARIDPVSKKFLVESGWNLQIAGYRMQMLPPEEQMALLSAPNFQGLQAAASSAEAQRHGVDVASMERSPDTLETALLVLSPLDDETRALALDAGDKLAAVAARSSGAAQAEAWLEAAQLYEAAGESDKRWAAIEQVAAASTGIVRYGAAVSIAGRAASTGDVDGAITRLREHEADADRYIAQDAALLIGSYYEASARPQDAITQYTKFLEKWPETPMSPEARARLTRLGGVVPAAPAPAEVPGTPAPVPPK